jgi:hypothetical protein
MLLAPALVVSMVVVVLSGPPARATAPRRAPYTSAELFPLLLTERDLPAGWSAAPVGPDADTAMPTRGLCGGRSLAHRARSAGRVGEAQAVFIADPFTGPVVSEAVWTFATRRPAASFMRSIRRAATRCGSSDHLDRVSGRRSKVTVTPGASSLTADTLSVSQTSSAPTVTTAGTSLYVRAEGVVLVVTTTGYSVEHALTEHFARQAVEKLGPALR